METVMKHFLVFLLVGLWPTMSLPQALITTGESGNILALRNKEDWVGVIGSYIAHFAQPSEEFRTSGPWGKFRIVVEFTATSDGEISQLGVVKSSGNKAVDNQILNTLDNLKLLPFTPDMGEADQSFQLPIIWTNSRPEVEPAKG